MYLRHLYPAPRSFNEDQSRRYTFGAKVTAAISGLDANQTDRVRYLWRRFSCDASELDVIPASDGFSLTIGSAAGEPSDADSYALYAGEAGVRIAAKDAQSLMNGVATLAQLICPIELSEGNEAFYISAAEVHDSPAVGFRGVHLCVFPDSELSSLEKAIHLSGFLKLTHVILEFWGTFRYECLPELSWKNHSYTADQLKPLIRLANSYGMEVIPMVNHLGHATQSRSCYGRHVTLNANPRLSKLFEPDGWTWCLTNPDTYKLLSDMRAELCDLCGSGGYFHIGCDEAYSFATCDKCREHEPQELLVSYLNRLTEDICKTGRRPIMWHDELIRGEDFVNDPDNGIIVANGQNHNTYKAIDRLDRRMIIADWQYYYKNGKNPTTPYFMAKGFDTLVCPWDNSENVRSLAENAKKLGALGIMLTTWDHLPTYNSRATRFAGCAWSESCAMPIFSDTEQACLLRRLYDADGDYERSGWHIWEVLE